jgi:hypothetical protein
LIPGTAWRGGVRCLLEYRIYIYMYVIVYIYIYINECI